MAAVTGLRYGALTDVVHLCVDMQVMFAEQTAWSTPWMRHVLPRVVALCERVPDRTIFTRFLPPLEPAGASGSWRRYYERWPMMTRQALEPDQLDLLPELRLFCPPARLWDKSTYSPWICGRLHASLAARAVRTIVVSGGETDVCVLATTLGAADLGYRVVVAADGLCSSADETHDAVLSLLSNRFGQQVETATIEEILYGLVASEPCAGSRITA
ncbi:cysteine hydrolase family protein [Brevundimonas sp.]|uniref:cysteine hydrolase family protein n=1 Tax=Brevundimonas sp. TaxID=1871086 RepID=UPI0035B134EF